MTKRRQGGNSRHRLVVLAAVLLASAGCRRERVTSAPLEPRLDATFPSNSIYVGDVATVRLSVAHANGVRVELPSFDRDAKIVMRGQSPVRSAPVAGGQIDTWDLKLTSFEVGTHLLATGSVRLVNADASVNLLPIPSATLRVESLLEGTNSATLRPAKELASWPGLLPPWFWPVAIIAVALTAAAALIARRLSRRRLGAPAAPPKPPHVVALDDLQRLREQGWMERGEVEPFYVELSRIVRRYIEDRFRLRAPELTTEEFIREASRSRVLSAQHQQLVSAFLEQSDLVKFARHVPGVSDMEAGLSSAENLVRETSPALLNHQPSTISS